MPNTQVQLTYQTEPAGASDAALAALMSAVPVPPDILQAAGLRVVSDVTPVANPVVRTIVLSFVPSVAPTATAALDNEGRVSGVTVTAAGLDVISPPQVSFVGGGGNVLREALAKAYLNMQDVALVSGGAAYAATTVAVVLGAMAPPTYKADGSLPPSCVQRLRIAVQGKGYSASAAIQFSGGLDPADPNARPAKAVITSFGLHGEILGVQLTDPGEGYIEVPKVVVVDPAHTGGGFMVVQPNSITGAAVNPKTTSSKFVAANLSPVMGRGTPASVTLTIVAGVITGAVVAAGKNGARYTQVPEIFIFDPTGAGSGGALTARMGVGSVELLTGGKGYEVAPSVTLTAYFKSLFSDGADQRAPFWKLIQTALQVNCISPVSSGDPVVS